MIKKDTPVEDVLKLGDTCKKCGKCCSMGSCFVLNHEIPKMARFIGMNETNFKKRFLNEVQVYHTSKHKTKVKKQPGKPYGHCCFWDQKSNLCKLHEVKPLYCQIGTCGEHGEAAVQWYYLNFFVNKDDASSIREWKIYTDMNRVIKGGRPEEIVGEDKLIKILNYEDLNIKAPKPKLR